MKLTPGLSLLITFGLCALTQGCAPAKPETSTPYMDEAGRDKLQPFNKLLNGSFPSLRQDTFYTTYKEVNGKKEELSDRFVSNGKGFVAYCESEGFDNGYYLYNFYGHSSYFVLIKDRTFRLALTSPGDDILRAYQVFAANSSNRPPKTMSVSQKLGPKKIDDMECRGIAYSTPEGTKHEEWFEAKSWRLIDQVVEGPGLKISRHLKRVNPYTDTMLLRLPEGFKLEGSGKEK